jgi:hypothetical protein
VAVRTAFHNMCILLLGVSIEVGVGRLRWSFARALPRLALILAAGFSAGCGSVTALLLTVHSSCATCCCVQLTLLRSLLLLLASLSACTSLSSALTFVVRATGCCLQLTPRKGTASSAGAHSECTALAKLVDCWDGMHSLLTSRVRAGWLSAAPRLKS